MLLEAAKERAPASVLDVGTGCGLASIVLSRAGCPLTVGTDISIDALRCAMANASRLAPETRFVLCDIFSAIKGRFDLILFNPPYLPVEAGGLEHVAWSGGASGRRLIDRFIGAVGSRLAPGGSALFVQSSLNDLDRSLDAAVRVGLRPRILSRESFFFEKLYVIELSR